MRGPRKIVIARQVPPNFLANDSALFSFRFCAVHLKEARDHQLQQFFEVPMSKARLKLLAASGLLLDINASNVLCFYV